MGHTILPEPNADFKYPILKNLGPVVFEIYRQTPLLVPVEVDQFSNANSFVLHQLVA
jgi:hypothetical protein